MLEEIILECEVYPTEDLDLILQRLYRYFPAMKFDIKNNRIIGKSNNIISLDYVRRGLKRYDVNSLKGVIKEENDYIVLYLDKLGLIKGYIHLVSGRFKPTMGWVKILIKAKNKKLIKSWLLL